MAFVFDLVKTDVIWIILGLITLFIYLKFKDKLNETKLFNFHYKNLFITILLPIIIIFVFLTIFRFAALQELSPGRAGELPIIISILSIIIIGPFFEEFFLRGLILGGSFFLASKLKNKSATWFFIIIGFLIQLFVFVWIHGSLEMTTRTYYLILTGLIYSFMFIFYKKNLLVPIIAHLVANLFILLKIFA